MTPNEHVLPDILQPDLKLVIVGTAAGDMSAKARHYYAAPRNRFWKTLTEYKLVPSQLRPEDDSKLPSFGIGLTDLAKFVHGRDSALDHSAYDIDAFDKKIALNRPRIVAFNGLKAASHYFGKKMSGADLGRQSQGIKGSDVFVVSQTSGGNGHWNRQRHSWSSLADAFHSLE